MAERETPNDTVPVVVNRRAGAIATHRGRLAVTAGGRALQWVEELQHQGRQPLWLVAPDKVVPRVETLLAAGFRRVAVGGGDGTLTNVAPLFMRHQAECVCLPLGTRNHFARDLGIPFEPDSWHDLLRSRRVLAVDVGLVNGRTFLNNVAVGLYPQMLRQRARLEGEKLLGSKRLASWWATLQVMRRRVHTFSVDWEIDGQTGQFTTKALLIASNAYTGRPFAPLTREALDRHELVLFVPRALGVGDIARMASYALAGNILDCPGLDAVSAHNIRLQLPARRVTAAIDGELVRLDLPLSVRHHQQRLQAVVPEAQA